MLWHVGVWYHQFDGIPKYWLVLESCQVKSFETPLKNIKLGKNFDLFRFRDHKLKMTFDFWKWFKRRDCFSLDQNLKGLWLLIQPNEYPANQLKFGTATFFDTKIGEWDFM